MPLILTLLFLGLIAVGGTALAFFSKNAVMVAGYPTKDSFMAVMMRWFAYGALLVLMFRVALGALGTI